VQSLLRALLILPEVALPAVIGVWAALRLVGPAWSRWAVAATLYVAYAAAAALVAAPLPSGMVLSWAASLVNQLLGHRPGTLAPQPFASLVGKAWLGIAVGPALLILGATAGLRRLERRQRRRRAAAGVPPPPPRADARILRLPGRGKRGDGPPPP
jgi:hypothetical protein